MTVTIGLIGAGVMGEDHARILAAGVPGAQLGGLYDANGARAQKVAADCGADRVFESAEALIASAEVDAVLVAAPDALHAPLVIACIKQGKPVLCEKPLADTLDGCRAVVAAEVARGRRLVQVGFMRRFDPGYVALRSSVISGEIGAPLFMHCVHRNAVGPDYLTSDNVIANTAVHEMDVGRYVLGEDFVAATVISPRASSRAIHRNPQFIVLETASGVVMDVEAFVDAQYGYDVRAELVGETGTIALAPNPPVVVRRDGRDGFALNPDWRGRFEEAYRAQMRGWVNAIQNGKPVGSSAWDGYVASATAAACLEAHASKRRVEIRLDPRPALYD